MKKNLSGARIITLVDTTGVEVNCYLGGAFYQKLEWEVYLCRHDYTRPAEPARWAPAGVKGVSLTSTRS